MADPTLYHQIIMAIALLTFAGALVNFAAFRKPRPLSVPVDGEPLPFVSVLVPARNEEGNIEACVRSILALEYPNFEVLVLDDRSTDNTFEILTRIEREQSAKTNAPRLRVLSGSDLPVGWCGKPHACWQLALAAEGEYLLQTDADCAFAPDALQKALGAMRDHKADLVSFIPDLLCEGFWERLLIPLQYYIILAFLPIPFVRGLQHPWFAAANGAFLFMSRKSYFDVDGHRAVRTQMAEDVKFAQHCKRMGKTMWYGDGSETYAVRMYEGLQQVWRGFSKNVFPSLSKSMPLLFGVIFAILFIQILPLVFFVIGAAEHASWTGYPATAYFSQVMIRMGVTMRFKRDSFWYDWINPLAWVIAIGIGINSAYRTLSKRGNEWKGRVYVR